METPSITDLFTQECEHCLGDGFIVKYDPETKERTREDCVCKTRMELIREPIYKELPPDMLDKFVPSYYYRDKPLDINALETRHDLPNQLKDLRFKTYLTMIEQLLETFTEGVIPKRSYIITAPKGFGKKTFVYNSIQSLLKMGRKPTPLLNTLEMQNEYFQKGYRYMQDLLLEHDILFVQINKTPFTRELMFLDTLTDLCINFGKPLILISERSAYDLSATYEDIITNIGVVSSKAYQYNYVVECGLNHDYMEEYKQWLRTKTKPKNTNRYNRPPPNQQNTSNKQKDDDDIFALGTQNTVSGIQPNETIDEYKERIRTENKSD